MRKVIVIGAGIGGLYAAKPLSELGYNVTVIEARERPDLGYPWYDSVAARTFSSVGLKVPEDVCIPKQVLNYYAPSGEGKIKQPDRAGKSLDVHREKLIRFLLSRLEPHCSLRFGERVTSLVIEDGAVKGVVTDKGRYEADLVIDSSGVFSSCRRATPDDFCLNDPLCENDYIIAYREVYSRVDVGKAPAPNVYLYPAGLMLAWVKSEPDMDGVDVFLGSYKEISPEEKERALAFLRAHNPCLGGTLLSTRKECVPLRYPLGVLSANGYAVIGNAAFMTKPFCGSGIEISLKAAKALVSVVRGLGDAPFTAENLWKYTLLCAKDFGAYHAAQYVFRQMIECLLPEDLDFLFTSGLFDKGVVAIASLDSGKYMKEVDVRAFYRGVVSAFRRKDILAVVKGAFTYALRAYFLTRSLPGKYDAKKVKEWKAKYDALMRAAPKTVAELYRASKE